jgi:phosphoglycerol transferase
VRLRRWEEAGYAALAAALGTLAGFLVLRPWSGSLHVPYSYVIDANFYHSVINGILEHGWFWHNPSLGAPGEQQLFDFPLVSGDLLNVVVWKVLGLFTSDAAVVMNLFFLLTFPAVGLTSYLVLRRLALSRAASIACSVLFTVMPYHFTRGEFHLVLAAYYAVPLGAYLVLAVLGERPLLASRRTVVGTLAMCAVIALASGGYYYSAFTVVLVAAAAVVRAIAVGSRRPLLEGGAVAGAILVLSLVTLVPSFVYWAEHGRNDVVAHRSPFESELYGLKFAQLVLPIEGHRVGELAKLRQKYDAKFPPTEAGPNTGLGIVAGLGLLWLLLVCFVQLASPGRRFAGDLAGRAGVAALFALMFAWTGGLSTFVAVVEPQIRAWNRLSIFIAFFGLIAVGLGFDRALEWMRRRWRWGAVAGLVGLAVVVVVGALDQTSRSYEPPYAAVAAEYRNDGDFVRGIESQVPAGSMIFQLPHRPFPEAPPLVSMADYDLFRGYLHSDDLRWSYGIVKGRGDDWSAEVSRKPVPELVRDVKAAGFAGIYLDRNGYADAGAAIDQQLVAATGSTALTSADHRLSFYRLR